MNKSKDIKRLFSTLYSGKDKHVNMNKKQESHLYFMLKYEINVKKYIPENTC